MSELGEQIPHPADLGGLGGRDISGHLADDHVDPVLRRVRGHVDGARVVADHAPEEQPVEPGAPRLRQLLHLCRRQHPQHRVVPVLTVVVLPRGVTRLWDPRQPEWRGCGRGLTDVPVGNAVPMGDLKKRLGAAATLIAAWGLILASVLGIGWLLTHSLESTVDPWDDDVARWFASERTGYLNDVADVGTFFGETLVGVAVAAVVGGAASMWRRSLRPALFFALALAGIGGFYWFGTELITRDRPPVRILDPGLVPNDSFPSGHVATALTVFGGTALLVSWLAPRARPWIWLLLLFPTFVALARLYQGAHHPTDVLTSLLYASAWLAVVATVLHRRTADGRPNSPFCG